MSLLTLILVCVLCAIAYWAWPKIPAPANWIAALIIFIICALALANLLGVPINLH